MRIVIAGATGLVGQEVLKLLLKDNEFKEIIVYSRRKLDQDDPRLRVVLGELEDLDTHRDELKADIFVSCLGTTIKTAGSKENFRKVDYEAIVKFGEIAKANGAQKFILVSAQGANADSIFFYPRVKGETEKALKDLSLSALTIFRPSLLVGERDEKRGAEELAIKTYRLLSKVLPESLDRRMGTKVMQLACDIVTEAKKLSTGVKVYSPIEI